MEFCIGVEELFGVSVEGIDFVAGHESDFADVDAEQGGSEVEAMAGGFEDGAVASEGDDEVDFVGLGELLGVDGVDDVDEGGVGFDDIAEAGEGIDGEWFLLVDQDEYAAGHD